MPKYGNHIDHSVDFLRNYTNISCLCAHASKNINRLQNELRNKYVKQPIRQIYPVAIRTAESNCSLIMRKAMDVSKWVCHHHCIHEPVKWNAYAVARMGNSWYCCMVKSITWLSTGSERVWGPDIVLKRALTRSGLRLAANCAVADRYLFTWEILLLLIIVCCDVM